MAVVRYEDRLRALALNPTGEWVALEAEERDALADAVEALRNTQRDAFYGQDPDDSLAVTRTTLRIIESRARDVLARLDGT